MVGAVTLGLVTGIVGPAATIVAGGGPGRAVIGAGSAMSVVLVVVPALEGADTEPAE
jgi:hypothetical protein